MLTKDEAIELTTEYVMATDYERGIAIPSISGWEDAYTEMTRERIRSVYEHMGSSYVLAPEFVWEFDRFNLMPKIRECCQGLERVWGSQTGAVRSAN